MSILPILSQKYDERKMTKLVKVRLTTSPSQGLESAGYILRRIENEKY